MLVLAPLPDVKIEPLDEEFWFNDEQEQLPSLPWTNALLGKITKSGNANFFFKILIPNSMP